MQTKKHTAALILQQMANEDPRKLRSQGNTIGQIISDVSQSFQAGFKHYPDDVDHALWWSLSINGMRDVADEILDVQDTPWRKQVDEAEKEIQKRESDLRRESRDKREL